VSYLCTSGFQSSDESEVLNMTLYFKGGRTPTASRQASRHETKETKAGVSIMTQTGVRRFS
jgi:hypothetical protein